MVEAWLIAPVMAIISILAGFYIHGFVKKQDTGTDKMRFVAGAIKQGARTFLNRMYKTLAYFIAGMALVLLVFLPTPIWATTNIMDNVILAFGYVFGAVCSGIAGWMGMDVATDANVRAASAARQGISKSFPIAFRGGAVMGTSVIGLALLGVSSIYFLTGDPNVILGFSFGASALALFAKAGGGIFTKTADIGADLV
jgi:K(+)-stimulated pyrophosphate-energized sodium pump